MKAPLRLKSVTGRPVRHVSRPRLESLEERALLSGTPVPASAYGNLPLAFEANQGQAGSQADFLARGSGYALALNPSGASLALHQGTGADVLRFRLVGADPAASVVGRDELITKTNYLIGSDPSRWRTDVPNYAKVEYQDIYPGIGLVYYGNQGQLEYDFKVAPGADPGAIRMAIQGAESLALDPQGNLVLHTAGGDVVQHAPVIYQESGGARQAIAGEFVLGRDDQVGFRVGAYDTSLPLVIDPILSYSSYLGGNNNDRANAIAVDAGGNAYITGTAYSANFPTTAGAMQTGFGGSSDAFVAKLNPSGTALVYSTYLGGTWDEDGNGVAVDAAGNAYVTGSTDSANFPTTAGAFQRTNTAGNFKGFVAKLNAAGTALIYSTYLGGSGGFDLSNAIAVDSAGNAYVTGSTYSSDFPIRNALQPIHADYLSSYGGYSDAFVTELNALGTAPVYSTFLGGTTNDSGQGIAVDAAGNAYVTGRTDATYAVDPSMGVTDFPTTPGAFQSVNATPGGGGVPFVTKVSAGGAALAYSTFLGGTTGYGESAAGIAVDAAGKAYVTGMTASANFPTTPGAFQRGYAGGQDAFVSALNPAGSALVYSTFLGGGGSDQALGVALDGAGDAYVVGITSSANFPTANAVQSQFGGNNDAFVTKLNPSGTALVYSTYLGGGALDQGSGIAVDSSGGSYVAGLTSSVNFPTTAGAVQRTTGGYDDAFVAKLAPASLTLAINDLSIVEGTSGTSNATFTVTLADTAAQAVTVHYATADGSAIAGTDYLAASGTLTFAPGQTQQAVTVVINGDAQVGASETFYVNLSSPAGATISRGQGVGTILDATKFYVVNDGSSLDQSYRYSRNGNSLGNSALNTGNTAPRGDASTAAGTTLWVADANKNVYVYSTGGGLLGSWTAGGLSSNARVEGIATNGTDVWIVDAYQRKVFRYGNAAGRLSGSQSASSSFSLNSSDANPKDIVTDGVSFWVVDAGSIDKVFKYSLAGSLLGSWTLNSGTSPTGITLDPTNVSTLWVVDSVTGRVYQYDNAARVTSGSLSPSISFALAAGNTNPQGIADPPAGSSLPAATRHHIQTTGRALLTRPHTTANSVLATVSREPGQSLAIHRRDQSVIAQAAIPDGRQLAAERAVPSRHPAPSFKVGHRLALSAPKMDHVRSSFAFSLNPADPQAPRPRLTASRRRS